MQALATVPAGIVHRISQDLERQITRRVYQRARDYIIKVRRNTEVLIENNGTYALLLHEIHSMERTTLTRDQAIFLQDDLNLRHAVIRSQQMVNRMLASEDVDMLLLCYRRGLNIRNTFWLHFCQATYSEHERARLMQDDFFTTEFNRCAASLQAELARLLTHIKHSAWSNVHFENIGPDHNVDDYGRDIYLRDCSYTQLDDRDDKSRCCICLEPYTAAHTAFEITACKGRHIVGKSCLSTWLNGTTLNANTCSQCRVELFERRALRPAIEPNNEAYSRLLRALDTFRNLERLRNELFGPESAAGFLWNVIYGVNYESFQNDTHLCLDHVDGPRPRLGIRGVSLHN